MVERAQRRGGRGSSLRVPTLVQPFRVGPVDTWVSRGVREVTLKQAVKDLAFQFTVTSVSRSPRRICFCTPN